MALQRLRAAIAPRCVESHGERLPATARCRRAAAAKQLAKPLRNAANLCLQGERGLAFEAQRERCGGRNRHNRCREDNGRQEQHDKPCERAAACQAAAAAGGIEEDRTRHLAFPQNAHGRQQVSAQEAVLMRGLGLRQPAG